MSKQYLSRESILQGPERRFLEEECPHRGGEIVRFRSLTEGELSRYEARTLTESGKLRGDRLIDAKRRLLLLTVVDAAGEPLFGADDIHALERVDGLLIAWMYRIACKHCGIRESEVEELVGNSGAIAGDGSRSD